MKLEKILLAGLFAIGGCTYKYTYIYPPQEKEKIIVQDTTQINELKKDLSELSHKLKCQEDSIKFYKSEIKKYNDEIQKLKEKIDSIQIEEYFKNLPKVEKGYGQGQGQRGYGVGQGQGRGQGQR